MKITLNKTGGLLIIGNNRHGGAFIARRWFGFRHGPGAFALVLFRVAVFTAPNG